jgi:hypothetical protein
MNKNLSIQLVSSEINSRTKAKQQNKTKQNKKTPQQFGCPYSCCFLFSVFNPH